MPLPNLKTRCTALCRARGDQCWNPAAYGCKTCRYHGAKRPEATRHGDEHGRYKDGEYTQAAKAAYRRSSVRINELEQMAFDAGLIRTRKAGRKPACT